MNAPTINHEVVTRFQQLRRRYRASRIGIALAVTIIATAALWGLLAYFDFHWEWSLQRRRIFCSLAALAILGGLVAQLYAARRCVQERRFASRLEGSFEGFGQRIRTLLDSVDGNLRGPDEMIAALGRQTLGRWESLEPARLIPIRWLIAVSLGGILAGLLFVGSFLRGGDIRVSMLRAVGADLPYTSMSVTPGDLRVMEGTPIEVALKLSGRTERDVVARYRYLPNADEVEASGAGETEGSVTWSEIQLHTHQDGSAANAKQDVHGQDADRPGSPEERFSVGLGEASDTIEYQFVTSVGSTRMYRIDVQPLIKAIRFETRVVPPVYTRIASRSFSAVNVAVVEGSTVTVQLQTNHPLHEANLEFGPDKASLRRTELVPSEDPTDWTFIVPTSESTHWRFTGEGIDGTPMLPMTGRVRVRPDSAPSVTWSDPPDQIRVHSLAELPLRVEVADDFGLSETGIVFQLGGDDEYVLTDWVAELNPSSESGEPPPTRMKLQETLPLESFELTERDFVSYYAFAVDNRGGAPQRTESDVRYIDIRPLRQYFTEVEPVPDDVQFDEVLLQLDEIIGRQRYLINRTRRLAKNSSVDLAGQLGAIDQLVNVQSELSRLTGRLADFMVTEGNDDAEALNQASEAMLQAADSLSAASFELALAQQDVALRALAEARRTLEMLITNSTPQQQESLRQFAKDMRQRLRPTRKANVQEFTDSLQRITSDQMQLIQTAQQITDNSMGGPDAPSDQESEAGEGGTGDEIGETGVGNGESNSSAASGAGSIEPEPNAGGTSDSETNNNSPNNNSPNNGGTSDRLTDNQANDGGNSFDDLMKDQPTADEQQERLYAEQIDLLKRLQAVQENVVDRLSDSSLLAGRFDAVEEAMDGLATQTRDRELDRFSNDAQSTVDLLREITMHMEALDASEPVSRISAVRDMTDSLAEMERQLAELASTDEAPQREREAAPESEAGGAGRQAMNDPSVDRKRIAAQMNSRADTIEDVLRESIAGADEKTSEVADNLEQFLKDAKLLDQLEATRDAAREITEPPRPGDSQGGQNGDQMSRAGEYGESVRLLDEMFRRLVAPRLTRLREIEAKANTLAEELVEAEEPDDADRTDSELRADIRALQQELQEVGLEDVAELLSGKDANEATQPDESDPVNRSNRRTDSPLPSQPSSAMVSRLPLVSEALRDRIQAMILKEISVDRDTPVPPEYRGSVNGYFRALAGESPTDGLDRDSPATSR